MRDQITSLLAQIVKDLYGLDIDVELKRPEEQFGDFSTNVTLKLAGQLDKSPRDIAEAIQASLSGNQMFEEVTIAGPGFINLKVNISVLLELAFSEAGKTMEGKVAVVEYSDPNPFKSLHAGHLYTSIYGDAVANLIANSGATVYRVNFGGDVGLHVAKSIWAIVKEFGGVNPEKLNDIQEADRSDWLSQRYIEGNTAFTESESAKEEIKKFNQQIYEISQTLDKESPLAQIYWTCRTWSYQYFEQFYARLNIKFDKYYPESEVAELGLKTVREHIPDVYEESQGAIVFNGEKHGLYTNVFINSEGVPTYAAKDVGLILTKWQDYHYDKSVIITDNGQAEYMKVVLTSVNQFEPDLIKSTTHITHGVVKLPGGKKMSSRSGNILKATDILDLAEQATKDKELKYDPRITIGAVKYSFLKQRVGADIVFDAEESVSIEGNSGPYLQYAYTRAFSILSKAESNLDLKTVDNFTDDERQLLRKIGEFSETVELATSELMPHHTSTYLYELAQEFNRFYEKNRVIDDERQDVRLSLIKLYSLKLSEGLGLLGMERLEKM